VPANQPDVSQPDDAQLPPRAWLMRNGIYLLVAAGVLAALIVRFGSGWIVPVLMVALGLGLVIFVHELGHFAVAKWCDVYVQTFSIGFGPALPGCRWKWGETVYKIALLPLGGYVQMLGEGTDDEEEQNNPRSYKNKAVGQRMLIISAGVVMNIILACVCFIAVYTIPGKQWIAGEIGFVDAGGPAFEAGLPSGAVLKRVGNRESRSGVLLYFDRDLQPFVIYSTAGEKIPIVYDYYEPGATHAQPKRGEVEVTPRKEEKPGRPMIGVSPPSSLELPPPQARQERPIAYQEGSAAAAARPAALLQPGDIIEATTDPDKPDTLKRLPGPEDRPSYTRELAERWYRLAGKPMTVQVRGAAEPRTLPPAEFDFGDTVVGSTDPARPDEVSFLPEDPRNPGSGHPDFFEFDRRLRLLAGQFMVIRVRRADGREDDLMVPPAYHLTLGVRMRMGQVVAIREKSPAATADVRKGDIIKQVSLKDTRTGQTADFAIGEGGAGTVVDPLRLPDQLQDWAEARLDAAGKGVEITLTVVRDNPQLNQARVPAVLGPVEWDNRWQFDREVPANTAAPVAVPCLGLSYQVDTVVEEVPPGSPAAGQLQKNDIIKGIKFQEMGTRRDEYKLDSQWMDLDSGQWAYVAGTVFQLLDNRQVTLKVERPGQAQSLEVTVEAQPDRDWPLADRGLKFRTDVRVLRASSILQAVWLGFEDTKDFVKYVYLGIRGMATRQVEPAGNMGGPITIARIAYVSAGRGVWEFLFLLGMISINLAVINFLPIPFLDGGHMVFLIYEKIRGRPMRQSVLAAATYAGLLFLLVVMVFVFYQDIKLLVMQYW
jgi:regulator of sigma E protease